MTPLRQPKRLLCHRLPPRPPTHQTDAVATAIAAVHAPRHARTVALTVVADVVHAEKAVVTDQIVVVVVVVAVVVAVNAKAAVPSVNV